ncbi:MAG: hypothetical protein ABI679_14865 [Gemmatimonadota bacterium]
MKSRRFVVSAASPIRGWLLLVSILFYSAQLGPELLDGLEHLEHRATQHTQRIHFEDPSRQSHSDRCLFARPACGDRIEVWAAQPQIRSSGEGRQAPPVLRQVFSAARPDLPRSRAPPVTSL